MAPLRTLSLLTVPAVLALGCLTTTPAAAADRLQQRVAPAAPATATASTRVAARTASAVVRPARATVRRVARPARRTAVTAPAAPAGPAVPAVRGVDVRAFGAVGDGVTDDTAALERALAAVPAGGSLVVPAGGVFVHRAVLAVRTPRVTVTGGGTLLGTVPARSSVWLDAPGVVLQDVTVRVTGVTRRYDAYEQMGVRVGGHDGVVLRRVTVTGSAAAGVYVGSGAGGWLLEDVTVSGTRADGIHITNGAHDGTVRRATVRGAGDDGVAVVSYARDGDPCRRIVVEGSRVVGGGWGRAFSVVGAEDVVLRDLVAEDSHAAAVYVATEGAPYFTTSTRRVGVRGVRLVRSNTSSTVDHGALLVYSGQAGAEVRDVVVKGLTVEATRSSASRQLGVIADAGSVAGISLTDVAVTGGPGSLWGSNVQDPRLVHRAGWTRDGVAVAL